MWAWRDARYLSADHDGSRNEGSLGVSLDAVVERNDVQTVEQLALVLVDPLDLHVEHGRQVDRDAVLLLEERRQLHLVLLLDRLHGPDEAGIVHVSLQLLQILQMRDPTVSDFLKLSERTMRHDSTTTTT